jgi:hypothetical protein
MRLLARSHTGGKEETDQKRDAVTLAKVIGEIHRIPTEKEVQGNRENWVIAQSKFPGSESSEQGGKQWLQRN